MSKITMIARGVLCIAFLSGALSAHAQTGYNWRWVQAMMSDLPDATRDIVTDGYGTSYSTGYTWEGADMIDGGSNYIGSLSPYLNGNDAYVWKHQRDGTFDWYAQISGDYNDEGRGIALTDNDMVITAGTYFGKTDVISASSSSGGTITLNSPYSPPGNDIYVARFDNTGALDIAFTFGTTNQDITVNAITPVEGNSFVVAGWFKGTCDFTPYFTGGPGTGLPTPITSIGQKDGYVAQFDNNGDLEGVWILGSTEDDSFNDVDRNGGKLVGCASYWDQASLYYYDISGGVSNFTSYSSQGMADILALELNLTAYMGGSPTEFTLGDTGDDVPQSINNSAGGFFVSGYFESGSIMDLTTFLTISNAGTGRDAFAFFHNGSNLVWLNRFGGTGDDEAFGTAIDENNRWYVSGYYTDYAETEDNSGVNQTGVGGHDIFGWRMNSSGASQQVFTAGDYGDDEARGIAPMPDGGAGVVFSGFYSVDAVFSPWTMTNHGSTEGFVARWGDPLGYRIGYEQLAPVTLFPNPSSGKVTFRIENGAENAPVAVYSSLGSKVLSAQLDKSSSAQLDMTAMPSGVYRVVCQGKTVNFVKQ